MGTDTEAPYQAMWNAPPTGFYALTAVATDNTNAVTSSDPVSITIGGAGTGYGTLGPPIASPAPGLYGAAQTVTLQAAPGAEISA